MKYNIKNLFPKLSAKLCAFGIIPMLLGPSFGGFTSPLTAVADMEGSTALTTNADEEVLWFARTIYSETKTPSEQTLVAWVIRNRVESERFPDTYKEVVLQRGQFSGMHATDKQYHINVSMTFEDTSPSWDSAVAIAQAVYSAPDALRPISKNVLHFYSPISVTRTPAWAQGTSPEHEIHSAHGVRFAFYAI